jgi:hypothetical protein
MDDSLLTPATSNTMMSPQAQAIAAEIRAAKAERIAQHQSQDDSQQESVPDLGVAQSVPTDEKTIILGLVEYLKRGAEHSASIPDQARWFSFCADWVNKKSIESGHQS